MRPRDKLASPGHSASMPPWIRLRLLAVAALVVAFVPTGAARADVAPPDDYVDPCKSVVLDASCRRCTAPEFKARSCHEDARAAGLVERCHGWGYAMYCGDGETPAPAPELTPTPTSTPELPPAPAPAPAPAPTPNPEDRAAPPSPPAAAAEAPQEASGSGCSVAGPTDGIGALLLIVGALALRRRRP